VGSELISALIGAVASGLLTSAGWILFVSTKIAILTTKVSTLELMVRELFDRDSVRVPDCSRHEAEIKELERRMSSLEARR